MKVTPILFSGPMVRALMDGRKTQTRRVINPQPAWYEVDQGGECFGWVKSRRSVSIVSLTPPPCPYGVPGDLLWVRERHCRPGAVDSKRIGYDADGRCGAMISDGFICHGRLIEASGYREAFPKGGADTFSYQRYGGRWRPSIHMPRWASRLTLRVTDVRVQRVQEISAPDLQSEGLIPPGPPINPKEYDAWLLKFAELWDSLNAKKHPWESNPWVRALTFEVIKANVDAVLKEAA